MSSTSVRLLAALALLATLTMSARVEAAAKSVTLLGVSGPDGGRFSSALEAELTELYELVPGAEYRRAAEQLGRRGASPEDVRAVALALHVDAVIGGTVVGQGRARVLLIAVREGASGRVIARGRYELGGRTLPLIRERVASDLVRALERVTPIGRARPQAEVEAEPTPGRESPSSSSVEDVSPAVAGDTSIAKRAAAKRAIAGVFGGVGPALLTRRLGFDVASAPSYSGGTVAGVRVEGAVFPLALSAELAEDHPVLASFGLSGSYESIFGFTSTSAAGKSTGTASRWNVLFVGRIPLGHEAAGGTLTLDTGWQRMSWSHAAPVDVGVPDVRYDAIAAGVGWDRPIVGRWATLALRGGYLGVLYDGAIASTTQYGAASAWGLSASASVTSWVTSWLWLQLSGSYDHIGLSFAGAGTRFAHSAGDDWIGGALEVGFAL